MVLVEPIPSSAAAIAQLPTETALLIADVHAGFEAAMRAEQGIELPSQADIRNKQLHSLLDRTSPDRLIILGDLTHSIGGPGGAERGELEVLFETIDLPVTLVKGNHDGIIEELIAGDPGSFGNIDVTDPRGERMGPVSVLHGHTWPDPDLLAGEVLCIGHEHPVVRLTDEVGGSRVERVWLRGQLRREVFTDRFDTFDWGSPEVILFPAFNELCGGTWVNVPGQSFLAPFLPDALETGDVYLLDGTHLGQYTDI